MVLPDGVLAYKFLNNANSSSNQHELIRATLTDLIYDNMIIQRRYLMI